MPVEIKKVIQELVVPELREIKSDVRVIYTEIKRLDEKIDNLREEVRNLREEFKLAIDIHERLAAVEAKLSH